MAIAGSIRSYLPLKRYGFIRGEDERDYFFHGDDLAAEMVAADLVEGRRVAFDGVPTPKGYKARAVRPLTQDARALKYRVPDAVVLDDKRGIDDWQILERASWIIASSGRGDPALVRTGLQELATLIGANAVLDVNYVKTTGSEPGSGSGTHFFTMHNFVGRPAVVGRPSLVAGVDADSLTGVDHRASIVKRIHVRRTEASRRRWWGCVAGILALGALGAYAYSPLCMIPTGFAILFALLVGHGNYDAWLAKAPLEPRDVMAAGAD